MLYPQARKALHEASEDPKVWETDIEEARRAGREEASAVPREEVAEVLDLDADGVACRLYRPAGAGPGLVVHLHGGGFVFHDVEVHDPTARRVANRCKVSVLSVDYRRPPEHPFPAAPDDVDVVLRWVAREGESYGLTGRIFLHGDSAGGNLALVAALRNPGVAAGLVLIYPFLDPSASFDSYTTAADGLDRREADWYWQQYASCADDLAHPDLAPLGPDLTGQARFVALPPTLVVTAGQDPLRDEGEHLGQLLAEAGVEVTTTRYLGQVHGFWRHPAVFEAAEPAERQVAGFVQMLLER